MEVKFEGTCIFEGDPIDEVLGLNSDVADECVASEQERKVSMAFKKEEKEFERQEFINKCIDVVTIIVLVVIFIIAAVPIIHSICS